VREREILEGVRSDPVGVSRPP